MKGDENIKTRRFTREEKKLSAAAVQDKSSVTNHADRNNCIIDWGEQT